MTTIIVHDEVAALEADPQRKHHGLSTETTFPRLIDVLITSDAEEFGILKREKLRSTGKLTTTHGSLPPSTHSLASCSMPLKRPSVLELKLRRKTTMSGIGEHNP